MLKPTVKEVGVTESERLLERIAEETFLSLWSYPSLYRSAGGGTELSDLTVCFGNTVILFSDKGQVKYQSHKETSIAWPRWYRSAIKDSAKQLFGAEQFIRRYPRDVYVDRRCANLLEFDLSSPDIKIHLIAVTRGVESYAKEYFDKFGDGSRGTLVSAYRESEETILESPFMINDLDSSRTFVHVLDGKGLDLLLTELASPPDFIRYLESKEKAVRKGGLAYALGEEELLAYYLMHETHDGYGSIPNPNQWGSFGIAEHQWQTFRASVPYALHLGRRKKASGWQLILKRFSDSIIDGQPGEGADLPLLTHSAALQSLAEENLCSRASLTSLLLEKYESLPSNVRSARVVPSLCFPEKLFVFVFMPWSDKFRSYGEYREKRLEFMSMYGLVARYKFTKATKIVVFGAMNKGGPESETIIVVDATVPLTSEERILAVQVMKNLNVLNEITSTRFNHTGDVGQSRVGRNELCPCGSGRKYKTCCLV